MFVVNYCLFNLKMYSLYSLPFLIFAFKFFCSLVDVCCFVCLLVCLLLVVFSLFLSLFFCYSVSLFMSLISSIMRMTMMTTNELFTYNDFLVKLGLDSLVKISVRHIYDSDNNKKKK